MTFNWNAEHISDWLNKDKQLSSDEAWFLERLWNNKNIGESLKEELLSYSFAIDQKLYQIRDDLKLHKWIWEEKKDELIKRLLEDTEFVWLTKIYLKLNYNKDIKIDKEITEDYINMLDSFFRGTLKVEYSEYVKLEQRLLCEKMKKIFLDKNSLIDVDIERWLDVFSRFIAEKGFHIQDWHIDNIIWLYKENKDIFAEFCSTIWSKSWNYGISDEKMFLRTLWTPSLLLRLFRYELWERNFSFLKFSWDRQDKYSMEFVDFVSFNLEDYINRINVLYELWRVWLVLSDSFMDKLYKLYNSDKSQDEKVEKFKWLFDSIKTIVRFDPEIVTDILWDDDKLVKLYNKSGLLNEIINVQNSWISNKYIDKDMINSILDTDMDIWWFDRLYRQQLRLCFKKDYDIKEQDLNMIDDLVFEQALLNHKGFLKFQSQLNFRTNKFRYITILCDGNMPIIENVLLKSPKFEWHNENILKLHKINPDVFDISLRNLDDKSIFYLDNIMKQKDFVWLRNAIWSLEFDVRSPETARSVKNLLEKYLNNSKQISWIDLSENQINNLMNVFEISLDWVIKENVADKLFEDSISKLINGSDFWNYTGFDQMLRSEWMNDKQVEEIKNQVGELIKSITRSSLKKYKEVYNSDFKSKLWLFYNIFRNELNNTIWIKQKNPLIQEIILKIFSFSDEKTDEWKANWLLNMIWKWVNLQILKQETDLKLKDLGNQNQSWTVLQEALLRTDIKPENLEDKEKKEKLADQLAEQMRLYTLIQDAQIAIDTVRSRSNPTEQNLLDKYLSEIQKSDSIADFEQKLSVMKLPDSLSWVSINLTDMVKEKKQLWWSELRQTQEWKDAIIVLSNKKAVEESQQKQEFIRQHTESLDELKQETAIIVDPKTETDKQKLVDFIKSSRENSKQLVQLWYENWYIIDYDYFYNKWLITKEQYDISSNIIVAVHYEDSSPLSWDRVKTVEDLDFPKKINYMTSSWWVSVINPFYDPKNSDTIPIIEKDTKIETNRELIRQYLEFNWYAIWEIHGSVDQIDKVFGIRIDKDLTKEDFQRFTDCMWRVFIQNIEKFKLWSKWESLSWAKKDKIDDIYKEMVFRPLSGMRMFFADLWEWKSFSQLDFWIYDDQIKRSMNIDRFDVNLYDNIQKEFYEPRRSKLALIWEETK